MSLDIARMEKLNRFAVKDVVFFSHVFLFQVTVDHEPDLPAERERVEKKGGKVGKIVFDDNYFFHQFF